MAHAPATIICTGTYWRNAWKYQARTYRHFGWDNGTLVANMLAVSAASGLPAEVVLGFVDAEVNRLLDLDPRREVSLCLIPIGRKSDSLLPAPRDAQALGLETIPFSQREIKYPAMLEMHDASSLQSEEEVLQWRLSQPILSSSAVAGEAVPLQLLPEQEQPKDTIEQVILRRGSTRRFDKAASIALAQLSAILDRATRGLPADFVEPPGGQLNDLYLIAHSVQSLKPGAYFFRRDSSMLELLKRGISAPRRTILDWNKICRPMPVWISSFSRIRDESWSDTGTAATGPSNWKRAPSAAGCTWLRMPSYWARPA